MFYIRIIASANGTRTPYAGMFVREYQPARMDSLGSYHGGVLRLTPHLADALGFPESIDAFSCYMRANGRRPDGKPNRPLTSYTVEIAETFDDDLVASQAS